MLGMERLLGIFPVNMGSTQKCAGTDRRVPSSDESRSSVSVGNGSCITLARATFAKSELMRVSLTQRTRSGCSSAAIT